ncbi:hypothetical protein BJX76DRAFT_358051 [Aspergillus varians]
MASMLWDLVAEYIPQSPRSRHTPPPPPPPPQQQHNHLDTEKELQREQLRLTARETLEILPALLRHLNRTKEAHASQKLSFQSFQSLNPNSCPGFPSRASIKVINDDTLNVAMRLSQPAHADPRVRNPRPIIINLASYRKPGGGWLNGAIAQEEAICYRSSLALSLNRRDYPLALGESIYSPFVLLMRGDMAGGHKLLTTSTPPEDLPVISVITIAALYRPRLRKIALRGGSSGHGGHSGHSHSGHSHSGHSHSHGSQQRTKRVFARDKDRSLTKAKMRHSLRIAAANGHGSLVLGALGCGVYGNPPAEVAHCWLEVLREAEFRGNWWREVCFAVYDPNNEGNYATFDQVLSGKKV